VFFLPFCEPIHPLFGAENCENYSLNFYKDAVYLQLENYVQLPNYSPRVRTDIYTHKLFLPRSDNSYQKVGVRFRGSHLVGEAFTRRNWLTEDYAFGFYGRWKGFGGFVYKGSEYPYTGQGILLSYSLTHLSVTGGLAEGGPSFGFQVGNRLYLRGVAYRGKDTLTVLGGGTTGSQWDVFALVGDGIFLKGVYLGAVDLSVEYTRTRRLNVGHVQIVHPNAGVGLLYGRWIGYRGVEIQTYLKGDWRYLKAAAFLSARPERTYTYRLKLILFPFNLGGIASFEPTLIAYETPNNGWYSVGLVLTLYDDLKLHAFYDTGTYDHGARVGVIWTLWD